MKFAARSIQNIDCRSAVCTDTDARSRVRALQRYIVSTVLARVCLRGDESAARGELSHCRMSEVTLTREFSHFTFCSGKLLPRVCVFLFNFAFVLMH